MDVEEIRCQRIILESKTGRCAVLSAEDGLVQLYLVNENNPSVVFACGINPDGQGFVQIHNGINQYRLGLCASSDGIGINIIGKNGEPALTISLDSKNNIDQVMRIIQNGRVIVDQKVEHPVSG